MARKPRNTERTACPAGLELVRLIESLEAREKAENEAEREVISAKTRKKKALETTEKRWDTTIAKAMNRQTEKIRSRKEAQDNLRRHMNARYPYAVTHNGRVFIVIDAKLHIMDPVPAIDEA